jgi:hypothetical protein
LIRIRKVSLEIKTSSESTEPTDQASLHTVAYSENKSIINPPLLSDFEKKTNRFYGIKDQRTTTSRWQINLSPYDEIRVSAILSTIINFESSPSHFLLKAL